MKGDAGAPGAAGAAKAASLRRTGGGAGQAVRARFLELLIETGNVRTAAARVEVPLSTVMSWQAQDIDFAAGWAAAWDHSYMLLHSDLFAQAAGTNDAGRKLDVSLSLNLLKRRDALAAAQVTGSGVEPVRVPLLRAQSELLRRIAAMRAEAQE
ncbi:hypothetical protein [Sphingomonas metalli]|nr:hypothetical protein [Sphingomonas metalli]